MAVYLRACVASCVFATVLGSASAITTIDNFTNGAQNLLIPNGTGFIEGQASGSVENLLGTQRDVLLDITSNPFNRSMQFEVVPGQGMGFTASGSGVNGFLQLDYDGLDSEGSDGIQTAGFGFNQNFLASGENAFSLTFEFSDSPVLVEYTIFTFSAGSSTASFMAASSGSQATYLTSFTSFVGGASFNDIDRIVVRFTPQSPATDFTISNFQAVPEPGTMVALGLGASALLARRRRNKK